MSLNCSFDDQCALGRRQQRIQALNDRLRQTAQGGRIMLSAAISSLPAVAIADIVAAVASFQAFDADNDPHGEHDCAIIEVADNTVMIDYYDRSLAFGAEDPADEALTSRVLTIMLAREY